MSGVTIKVRCLLFTAALAVLALPVSELQARVKPVTELEALPENKAEQNLWDVAAGHLEDIESDGRVLQDADMEAYLSEVAQRLVQDRLDHLDIEFKFVIVRNNLLSAWVYPYGTIAVNTGLLAGMENEAQLAAILGHEISHFLQRHSYRELIAEKRQSVIGKGLGVLATAAVAAQTGVVDTQFMKTGGLWTGLVTNGYSRKLEHAADAEGLQLMAAANYNQEQAIAAFRHLNQNAAYGVVNPRLLWSSHPTLEDRIKNLQKSVARAKRKKNYEPGEVPPETAYRQRIAPALRETGLLDLRDRQFERALKVFEKYRNTRPQEGLGSFLIGETLRLQAPDGPDFEPRIQAYQQAAAATEPYAAAHKELGMAYRQMGDRAAAEAAFQQYLQLSEDAVDAGIIRGYLSNLQRVQ